MKSLPHSFAALMVAMLLAGANPGTAHAQAAAGNTVDDHKPGTFLSLITPAGRERLSRSQYKVDHLDVSTHFATQITQTLCSVATAVTLLNALQIERPIDPLYEPYDYFTQTSYFTEAVSKIRTYDLTLTEGMTLQMAASAMRTHGAVVTAIHASDTDVDQMRAMMKDNLKSKGDFIAINYQRAMVGQPKGGHFTPVSAYDEKTDSFLVMDVARYKFPPVWVRAEDLYKAMNTQDSEVPKTRGFLFVSRPKG